MWDSVTGQEIRSFTRGDKEIYSVAVNPAGNLVAASDQDGTVYVWDVNTGEMLHKLRGHAGLGLRVTFSNDGARLASVSFDRLAKVWDVATGEELASLYGNASNAYAASFSLDGNQLVTAGADGTIRIYTLEIEGLIALAKSRLTRTLTVAECQKYLHMDYYPSE